MTEQAKRIIAVSGATENECSCEKCRELCRTPCLGTPEDIDALITAGYGDRLAPSIWLVGKMVGLTDRPIRMLQPKQENGWCTFRRPDGLCELHDKGLKPLEGRLATCKPRPRYWTLQTDFTCLIAKTWLPYQEYFPD